MKIVEKRIVLHLRRLPEPSQISDFFFQSKLIEFFSNMGHPVTLVSQFQGHKISLKTALKIVEKCIVPNLRRLPEPLFMADLMSREQVCEQYKDSQLHVNQVEYEAQRRRWNTFIRNNMELDWKEKNQLEKKLKTKRR